MVFFIFVVIVCGIVFFVMAKSQNEKNQYEKREREYRESQRRKQELSRKRYEEDMAKWDPADYETTYEIKDK